MKKISLFAIGLILGLGQLFAQIDFEHTSWGEVKAKAKKENKLIFVDAYATWCGPCKYMSGRIFTNEEVGKYYNKNFINYKIDMESAGGDVFGSMYRVEAYPTLLFIDGDGEVVKKQTGAVTEPDAFIQLGKVVLNPELSPLYQSNKKYESGNRDKKFLVEYIITCFQEGEEDKALDVISEYNKEYKTLDLNNSYDLFIYCVNSDSNDLDNPLTIDFSKNFMKYHKNMESTELAKYELVQGKFVEIIEYNYAKAVKDQDEKLLNKVVEFTKLLAQIDGTTEQEIQETEDKIREMYKEAVSVK
ncbi:MAG: thioredoxin [Cytophagales bacterium]|nr:thioredoxin [Cytophagales bacterium]